MGMGRGRDEKVQSNISHRQEIEQTKAVKEHRDNFGGEIEKQGG